MNLKKLMLLGMFFVLSVTTYSQAKMNGNLMINIGISRSNLYQKLFVLGGTTKNGPYYPKSQTAISFIDFNVMYFFKKEIWKLKPVIGVGHCPQGFIEKGIVRNDSQQLVDYSVPLKISYSSLFAGFSYKFISTDWINLKFIQTINPMFDLNKPNSISKKFALASRSTLLLDIKFKNGGIASISPFFHTSVTKFNKTKKVAESPNYYPYSFGITVGTYFQN